MTGRSTTESDGRFVGDLPLTTAAAAANHVEPDDTVLVSGFGSVGDPKAVPEALAASGSDRSLTVISGGSVGPPIDTELVEAGAVSKRLPFVAQDAARTAINDGHIAFHDPHVGRAGEAIETGVLADADMAIVEATAVGEDMLIPSTSVGGTPAFVAAADRLIVEVNHAQPRSLQQVHDIYRPGLPPDRDPIPLASPGDRIGSPRIRFDPGKLVAVVETDRLDSPYTFREPSETDQAIAANLVEFLGDEMERNAAVAEALTLQFGVGSLGNAMMSGIADLDTGGRSVAYFGEVIQDGLLDLMDAGLLDAASATSLALSAEGQTRLFADIDRYAEDVVLRPVDVSNRAELIDRFGVIAINSALEVDLYGHVNSTHVDGRRLVGGVGGSGDFNQNALVAVTALPSSLRGGRSRVVPHTPHVDHTEHDIDVIVTEEGVADLRGSSPIGRATAIIEHCAHPDYRDELRRYLSRSRRSGGHLPYDPTAAIDWRR